MKLFHLQQLQSVKDFGICLTKMGGGLYKNIILLNDIKYG